MASSSAPHCFSKRAAAANAISLGAMLAARDFQYLPPVGKKKPALHNVNVWMCVCCCAAWDVIRAVENGSPLMPHGECRRMSPWN